MSALVMCPTIVGSPTMGSDGTELHAASHTNAAEMAGPVQRRSTLADFFLIAGFRFLLGGAQHWMGLTISPDILLTMFPVAQG